MPVMNLRLILLYRNSCNTQLNTSERWKTGGFIVCIGNDVRLMASIPWLKKSVILTVNTNSVNWFWSL